VRGPEAGAGSVYPGTVHSVVGAWVKIGGGGAISGSSGSGTYSDWPSAERSAVGYAVGPGSSSTERKTVCDRISAITASTTTEPPMTASMVRRERCSARLVGAPSVVAPRRSAARAALGVCRHYPGPSWRVRAQLLLSAHGAGPAPCPAR